MCTYVHYGSSVQEYLLGFGARPWVEEGFQEGRTSKTLPASLAASPQHRPPVGQLVVDFLQGNSQLPTGEAAAPSDLIHVGSEHSTADVWHQRGHACQDNEGSMVTDAPWQYCGPQVLCTIS